MLNRLIKIFISLRLTVVLLAFAILLVFIGTIAQVDEGLYNAQARYFRQWLIVGPVLFAKKLPLILPGGYLIGTMLLVNLLSAHIHRFELSKKKLGIQLAHSGVILLLVGQLTTDMFSYETHIRFSEGQTKSYSEAARDFELAFTTDTGTSNEQIISIPERLLARGGEIKNESLPFTIRVKSFWKNSEPSFRAPMAQNGPPLATNGIGANFDFRQMAEIKTMDDKNIPAALIEIIGPNGSLGDWVVSGWTDEVMVEALGRSYARRVGDQMAQTIVSRIMTPQFISVNGKQFSFKLRAERFYHPFSLTLLKATHTTYPGRPDIPKDFRSRVRIENAQTRENRETEIFMNSPLRYAGLTFYQYQMAAGEMSRQTGEIPSSTLQVVRNPSWLTPYVGCAMVAAGLITQFMYHLVGFIKKRKLQAPSSKLQ